MTATKPKPKADLPEPVVVDMKPHTYRPSKAELDEKHDMPGMTEEQVRCTFMRPFERKGS